MEFLSRLLSSITLGLLFIIPAQAYVPDLPSINQLPEYKKHLILNGHTAPYSDMTVKRVVLSKAKIMPNGAIIKLPGPQFVPELWELRALPQYQEKDDLEIAVDPWFGWTDEQKRIIDVLFWTAQILDVYTTYHGVKYDCVAERNPLLDEVPEFGEMIFLKGSVIGATYHWTGQNENFWYGWKLGAGVTTGMVVANNFRVLNRAKKRCNKR